MIDVKAEPDKVRWSLLSHTSGSWRIRSWMVDRHEVLTTVVIETSVAGRAGVEPTIYGLDLYSSEEDTVAASAWWIAEDGELHRRPGMVVAGPLDSNAVAQFFLDAARQRLAEARGRRQALKRTKSGRSESRLRESGHGRTAVDPDPQKVSAGTKADLIRAVASSAGVSPADAERILTAFFNEVVGAVRRDGKVAWPGFGTFSLTRRPSRRGRNPQTGEIVTIQPSKSVKFIASSPLESSLNRR
jgi:DNA-binding protein HU-beta